MRASPNNFLYFLKQIVTGGGYAVNSNSSLKSADGGFNKDVVLPLTGSAALPSGTTASSVNNVPIVSSAASSTALTIGNWSFVVPRDYDETTDKALVRVFARSAGATDTPILTVASSTTALGGTVGVAGSTVAGTALTATEAVQEYDLSGQKLVRDSILSFQLTSAVHNTDAVQVFAVELVYASCLVAFGDASFVGGDPKDLGGNDALGNPLR